MSSTNVFEEKNTAKAVLTVAFPAMLGQLTTLIYNIADTYFVSLTGDPRQIAAVTLSAPVLLILMSIANIFAMGGSSVIARLLGESREKGCRIRLLLCPLRHPGRRPRCSCRRPDQTGPGCKADRGGRGQPFLYRRLPEVHLPRSALHHALERLCPSVPLRGAGP